MFDRNEEKNDKLFKERGIRFEDVVIALQWDNLIADGPHPNQELYPHQYAMIVRINEYPYLVPYIKTTETRFFLKTIYPCRKYK